MKIFLITPLLATAGVPLAQIRFARALVKRGHNVVLIIGYISPEYNYELPTDLNCIILNKKKVRYFLLPLIFYFKKHKPDIIFSAEDHLNNIVLLAGLISSTSAKISCSSRVTPYDTYSNKIFSKGWILKLFTKALMVRADALTCVSEDMVLQYKIT